MERLDLLKTLKLVEPALARKEFIPIFSSFCFNKGVVTAFNDLIGIKAICGFPLDGAIKGGPFLGLLSKTAGQEVSLSQEGHKLKVVIGGTDFELPILPPSEFLFEFPKVKSNFSIALSPEYMEGIKHCLVSASIDTSRPEMMGVTLDLGDVISLFSTDNVSVSQFKLAGREDGAGMGEKLILPTEFCRTLVSLYESLKGEVPPLLMIGEDYVVVDFGDNCSLFSKLSSKKEPLDFTRLIKKHTGNTSKFVPIPKEFRDALVRANILIDTSSSVSHGICTIAVKANKLTITSSSDYGGNLHDVIDLASPHPDIEVLADPNLITRVINICDQMSISDGCIVFKGGENFMHLVATQPRLSKEGR